MGNYNITSSQVAGNHGINIGELHIEELHLHLACDPKGRRKDMEKESYNDKCHRLMDEAGMEKKDALHYIDEISNTACKLDGLGSLLMACDPGATGYQPHWTHAGWAFTDLSERIKTMILELWELIKADKAKIEELETQLQKLEASPTPAKRKREAPEGQNS